MKIHISNFESFVLNTQTIALQPCSDMCDWKAQQSKFCIPATPAQCVEGCGSMLHNYPLMLLKDPIILFYCIFFYCCIMLQATLNCEKKIMIKAGEYVR